MASLFLYQENVMGKKTKDNPSGSPFGKYSLLNKVIKGVDSLTGYDRNKKIKTNKDYKGSATIFKGR